MSVKGVSIGSLVARRISLGSCRGVCKSVHGRNSVTSVLGCPISTGQGAVIRITSTSFSMAGKRVNVVNTKGFASTAVLPTLAGTKTRVQCVTDTRNLSTGILTRGTNTVGTASSCGRVLGSRTMSLMVVAAQRGLRTSVILSTLQTGGRMFMRGPLYLGRTRLGRVARACRRTRGGKMALAIKCGQHFSPFTIGVGRLSKDKIGGVITAVGTKFVPSRM